MEGHARSAKARSRIRTAWEGRRTERRSLPDLRARRRARLKPGPLVLLEIPHMGYCRISPPMALYTVAFVELCVARRPDAEPVSSPARWRSGISGAILGPSLGNPPVPRHVPEVMQGFSGLGSVPMCGTILVSIVTVLTRYHHRNRRPVGAEQVAVAARGQRWADHQDRAAVAAQRLADHQGQAVAVETAAPKRHSPTRHKLRSVSGCACCPLLSREQRDTRGLVRP